MVDQIIEEINKALDNDCYLVALMTALTLPDICGAVEYPKESEGSRYKKWYAEYIGQYETDGEDKNMPYASADVIYDLRCFMVHNGNPTVDLKKRDLKSFELWITKDMTSGGGASYCESTGERTLELGIRNICFKLCALAKYYYDHNKEKFNFNYTIKDMRNRGI